MTKADQIRMLQHLSNAQAASHLGVDAHYVRTIRWRDKNPQRFRDLMNRGKRRRAEGKSKSPGFWTPDAIAHLKRMLNSGAKYTVIAHQLGTSVGAISGKVDRLRDAGEIA